jgi:large subunit ribosomal protein L3
MSPSDGSRKRRDLWTTHPYGLRSVRVFFMKFILATKEYMTQVYDADGVVHPATVLSATPNKVTQVKTTEIDGYNAVQVAFGARKEKRVNQAQRPKGLFHHFREYRVKDGEAVTHEAGALLAVDDVFAVGDKVMVSGLSKAKGFQGVVKRHGFAGGPRTHGQAHGERQTGSIGGGLRARVPKGKRMAGRTGGRLATVKNLTVVGVDKEKNQLIVEGAVPGRRGTLIEVRGL